MKDEYIYTTVFLIGPDDYDLSPLAATSFLETVFHFAWRSLLPTHYVLILVKALQTFIEHSIVFSVPYSSTFSLQLRLTNVLTNLCQYPFSLLSKVVLHTLHRMQSAICNLSLIHI